MTGDLSVLSVPLTSALLLRFIDQADAPPDPIGQGGGSLVLGKETDLFFLPFCDLERSK